MPRATRTDALRSPTAVDQQCCDDARVFEFKDAVFEDGKTRIRTDAKLYFDNRDGLDLEAFAPVFHFGTIDRKVAGLGFGGNGKVWAQVKGPYNALKIGGRVELEDFVFEKYRIGKIKIEAQLREKSVAHP